MKSPSSYITSSGRDPFEGVTAQAIRAVRGCGASGKSLTAGGVYSVPDEVSLEDARILVAMGKAVFVSAETKPDNREDEIQKGASTKVKGNKKEQKDALSGPAADELIDEVE